jgi:hypothetical protein
MHIPNTCLFVLYYKKIISFIGIFLYFKDLIFSLLIIIKNIMMKKFIDLLKDS